MLPPGTRRILRVNDRLTLMARLSKRARVAIRTIPNQYKDGATPLLLDLVQDDPGSVRLRPQRAAEVERRLQEPSSSVTHNQVLGFFRT